MSIQDLSPRHALLWRLHDFSSGSGLEIGPLHNTTVRRDRGTVSYLDVFDRAALVELYASDPNVPVDDIPEIDFPLHDGTRVRSIPEAVGGCSFDWVMASHVVEHVPDLIGWLDQIADITVDGGRLVLAVPDRRYCFDVHRPGTTVGQLLQAHELAETVPSVRAVYDYKRGHTSLTAPQAWSNQVPGYERRIHDLEHVRREVARAREGEYVDAHVWTFTPGTFVEQLIELRDLGLSEWRFDTWTHTRRDHLEFYAVLRRLPRSGWGDHDLEGEPRPVHNMPDWLAEDVIARRELAAAQKQVAEQAAEIEHWRGEARAQRLKVRRVRRRLRSARSELSAVRRSVRWRIGGVATAPARALRRVR